MHELPWTPLGMRIRNGYGEMRTGILGAD
jgi:hypothetical protein